jgi:hypothetical protein
MNPICVQMENETFLWIDFDSKTISLHNFFQTKIGEVSFADTQKILLTNGNIISLI